MSKNLDAIELVVKRWQVMAERWQVIVRPTHDRRATSLPLLSTNRINFQGHRRRKKGASERTTVVRTFCDDLATSLRRDAKCNVYSCE